MKKTIKLISALLAVIMVLTAVGCGKTTDDPKGTPEATEVSTEAPAENTPEATDTATEAPTEAPTTAPTEAPTEAPTAAPTEAPTEAPTAAPTETPKPTAAPTTNKKNVLSGKNFSINSVGLASFKRPLLLTDGNVMYHNDKDETFADVKFGLDNFNADQDKGKGDGYPYIAVMYVELDAIYSVDSFALYGQGCGQTAHTPQYNINAFDILVSMDHNTWTVAYSEADAAKNCGWQLVEDENYKYPEGYMTAVYRADFTPVEARYVMLAIKEGRPTVPGPQEFRAAGGLWTRLSEFQVFTGSEGKPIPGKAEGEKTLRTDNFAIGKLSEKFLDSLTDIQLAEISHLMWYEAELQRGISLGQKWVYTNSSTYSPQATSFDNMVKSGKYGTNCAMPAGWVMVDLGVLNEGQRFWGDGNGEFANYSKVHTQIEKAATITKLGGKTFSTLYNQGKVKPGDIFLAKGHTFIWLGDGKFLAAGHDGKWHSDSSAPTEDAQHAVFETWIKNQSDCADWSYSVTYQISFNDDYAPKTYRNSEGKIVKI